MLLEGVRCGWFEHRDVKHRVNSSHCFRKMECERLRTRLSNYLIWSEVLFGEFFRWTRCTEIL